MKRVVSILCLAVLCLVMVNVAMAQTTGQLGALRGTVTDPEGKVVPGATVTVTDTATNETFTTKASQDGSFAVGNLAPGTYKVSIVADKFKTFNIADIKVIAGSTYDVPAIKLELGAQAMTTEVNAGGAAVLETTSHSVTTTITGKQITNLPFNSRSALLMGILDPGAQTSGGSRNSTFEGLPKGTINITFDGINIQDNVLKSSDGFFAINDPRIDDVAEFNITTAGNSVDKSGEGAVQMGYVSNRGGNQFHGGIWETFRNDYLNANYYYSNMFGQTRQLIKFNDYGYKVGGPIWKDKLFFFTDFDFFVLPQSVLRTRSILTPLAASGVFRYSSPAGTQIQAGKTWVTCTNATAGGAPATVAGTCDVNFFGPGGLAALANAGAFNTANNTTPNAIVGTTVGQIEGSTSVAGVSTSPTAGQPWQNDISFNNVGSQTRKYPDLRLDFNASKHNSFEFDYHYAHFNSLPDLLNNVDVTYPVAPFSGNQGIQLSNRNLFVLAWRWNIGASASNELRGGVQVAPVNFSIGINKGIYPQFNTNLGPIQGRFGITGMSSTPWLSLGGIQGRNAALLQLLDNFTVTKGTHTMSFGFNYTDLRFNDFFTLQGAVGFGMDTTNDPIVGIFTTNLTTGNLPGIASNQIGNARNLFTSLTGRISSYSSSVAFDPATGGYNTGKPLVDSYGQIELGFFGSDSWRLRPNLTLNFGLRWEYDGVPSDRLNEYFMLQNGYADLYGQSGLGNLFHPGNFGVGTNVATTPTQFFVNDKGRSWANKYYRALAPSVGIAWQPNSDNSLYHAVFGGAGKTVIRTGYSITYSREGLNNFASIAGGNPGYLGSQFANSSNVSDPVNGLFVAGSLNLGPGVNGNAGTITNNAAQNPTSFTNIFPLTPSSGAAVNSFATNIKPPMVQSWETSIQRELSPSMAIELRYVGNHGVGLWRQYNINEANIFENGFLTEFQHAQTNAAICSAHATACTNAQVALGVASPSANAFGDYSTFDCPPLPTPTQCQLVGQIQLPLMTAAFNAGLTPATLALAQLPMSAQQANSSFRNSTFTGSTGFLGLNTPGSFAQSLSNSLTNFTNWSAAGYAQNLFVANPAARGGAFPFENATQSTYNAGIVDFRRRPSHGLQFDVSYTFQKSLTNYNGNSSVDFAGFTTLRDRNHDKGPAPFDIRHSVKATLIYELPFGPGHKWTSSNGIVNRIIGGWEINTVTRWQTGPPILITSGLGGTFNGNDPGINLIGITPNQLQSMLTTNKTEIPLAVAYVPTSLLNLSAPTAISPVGGSNTSIIAPCQNAGNLCNRVFVWGPNFTRADWSLMKTTKITERVNFELRAEMLNAFNHANFYYAAGSGTSPVSISTQSTRFGQMGSSSTNGAYQDFNTTQDPGGRILQIVGRINF